MVEAEDNSRLDRHAMRMNALDCPGILIHAVESFRDCVQAGLRDRLEPDKELLAPAARG